MIAFTITVQDGASPVVRALEAGLKPERVAPIVGKAVTNTVREHLFAYNSTHPNQLGGTRTNYYTGAARGTQFQVQGDLVVISINQVGIAQRYFGGTITPKTAKYLTIPVHPAAHGHRASEFDLEIVFGHGGKPIALATKKTSDVRLKQAKSGKVTKTNVTRFGEIYFRLVKSVTQLANPDVIPSEAKLQESISDALDSYTKRVLDRKAGGAA